MRRSGFTLIDLVIVVLGVAVIGMAIAMYNMNARIGQLDEKGRRLREWAVLSAKWSTHVNRDHLATDHTSMKVAPTHIPPPPDPPDGW